MPRLPPEPYSVIRPFPFNNNNGLNQININQNHNPINEPVNNQDSGNNNNNNNLDLTNDDTIMDDGPDTLITEQSNKLRKPAKFFLGKPQKIQTSS